VGGEVLERLADAARDGQGDQRRRDQGGMTPKRLLPSNFFIPSTKVPVTQASTRLK
jgi:hypothetical protein